jgi:phosphopantetheinyl transferase
MEIILYLVNINDIKSEYETFLNKLNEEEKKKIERAYKEEDRLKNLVSALLKKKFIKGLIYYNQYNKPYSKDVFFSISHSKDMVGIVLSKDSELGLDIEYNKKDRSNLYNKILSINEKKEGKDFYYYWTRKESYLKLLSTGIPLQTNFL